jgi:hypothetical protein
MSESPPIPDTVRGHRTLLLIAMVCVVPIVASYVAYYVFPRGARVNYGTLLAVAPATVPEGVRADGAPFRLRDFHGRWAFVFGSGAGCDDACQRKLYATRQARAIQGPEQDRVVRVWLVTDNSAPDAALLAQQPGLVVARVPGGALDAWPSGSAAIYLLDPLGNLVLSYPDDPDIKGVGRDLARLLKASRIG